MMWRTYIKVTVSLVEAAKVLSQGAENGLLGSKAVAQTALQPALKRNVKHNLKGVSYA